MTLWGTETAVLWPIRGLFYSHVTYILVLFEMLPYCCESELNQEETATLWQFKALFRNKANDQQVWKRMSGVWITMLRRSISVQDWALTMPHMVAVVCGSGDVALGCSVVPHTMTEPRPPSLRWAETDPGHAFVLLQKPT